VPAIFDRNREYKRIADSAGVVRVSAQAHAARSVHDGALIERLKLQFADTIRSSSALLTLTQRLEAKGRRYCVFGGWVRDMITHLIDKGIRVNAVAPGPVWTSLNPADRDAEGVSKFGSDTPMKRPAQPEEIAPAFVFLASPSCSSYITGEILPIIGGYSGG